MRITLLILNMILMSAAVSAEVMSPDEVAKQFYSWMFSAPGIGSGLPTPKEKEALTKFFSPILLKLLDAAVAMEEQCVERTPPGDKPHIIEGNILVGHYEGATEVIVGQPRTEGKNIVVESRLVSIDTQFPKSHRYRVSSWIDQLVISQEGDRWVINNIKFESNESLAGVLENYLKNSDPWCKAPNYSLQPTPKPLRGFGSLAVARRG